MTFNSENSKNSKNVDKNLKNLENIRVFRQKYEEMTGKKVETSFSGLLSLKKFKHLLNKRNLNRNIY